MRIKINLYKVKQAGSVEQAIVQNCPDDILVADSSAMGGQTFATSGPGPGWTCEFDASDYAKECIESDIANGGGAPSESSAINPETGRLAHGVDPAGDEEWDGEIDWEEDSCVCIECPSIEDAIDDPKTTATMAQAVIDHHSAESDTEEWAQLIRRIRAAAEALEDIDLDDLE